jgi:NAD(P)-dependent dehydrogenase (short-subunit alcohol dehydrogenase family)
METNYFVPLLLSRAFAPILAKNGGGAIVNMRSILSWVAVPNAGSAALPKPPCSPRVSRCVLRVRSFAVRCRFSVS